LGVQAVEPNLSGAAAYALAGIGTVFVTVAGVVMGRVSGLRAAREVIAPVAGPPFRRTFSLYGAFGRYARRIRGGRTALESSASTAGKVDLAAVVGLLDVLEAQVAEQLESSNDAADEWDPIFPDQVAALRQQARERAEE
jgi:hypothetical protein